MTESTETTETTEIVSKVTAGKNAIKVVEKLKELHPELKLHKYALVAKGDLFDVVKYLMDGEMTLEVAQRIVDAAYGTSGKPSARTKTADGEIVESLTMPVITDLLDEAFKAIPKEDLVIAESKATPKVATKVAVKSALIDAAKRAMSSGFTLDQIKGFLPLTDEELAQLTAE